MPIVARRGPLQGAIQPNASAAAGRRLDAFRVSPTPLGRPACDGNSRSSARQRVRQEVLGLGVVYANPTSPRRASGNKRETYTCCSPDALRSRTTN